MKAKRIASIFVPPAFCAFISMMALFMGDNALPAFYAFLPMCFFFVTIPLIAMNKRIADLEDELKRANDGNS